jgi:uncharacterized protein YbgA (DUF1722 family)/uncharacterized protein YbbK (DUF523 family)
MSNTDTHISRIRVGISTCLLGENVRFDGGHKHDPFLTETLGHFFEWVPVCPEVEIGLGTPRESLRLIGTPESPRLVAPRSGKDHTETMQRYTAGRVEKLAASGIHGYVLKKDSPSCGMLRVRVYGDSGMAVRTGRGLFADALLRRFPLLPVEEEGRLHDPALRENFIERVFALHRWQGFLKTKPRPKDLVAFHTGQKLTLMAHNPAHYQKLGQLVAKAGRAPLAETLAAYGGTLMEGLGVRATTKKHANVLYHLAGYLKDALDAGDKAELVERIEDYRKGLVPLIVPLTILAHHFRRHPNPWVGEQTYLNPYPAELMLRNHV